VNGDDGLSVAERDELVRAFLAVDGMRDRKKREMYLDELSRALTTTIAFVRYDEDHHDVHGLVAACLNYPGAIHELVGILRIFHGGTTMMEELDRVVRRLLPDPLLRPAEVNRLDRLLSDVEPASLSATYRESFGPLGPAVSLDGRDRLAVLRVLEEIGSSPDGPPPLLMFMERLAHALTDEAARALRRWIDEIALRLGISTTSLHALRAEPPRSTSDVGDRSYLVVLVDEDPLNPQQYQLTIWLQQSDGADEPLQVDEEPRQLSDIPHQVDRLLREVVAPMGTHLGDLTVEVILPRVLLGHPVDEWAIRTGPGDTAYPIGVEYPVVVRSLERMRNQAVRHRWQRKWRRLQSHGATTGDRAVHWIVNPGTTIPEQLLSELLYDEEDSPFCLVLAAPPIRGCRPGHELDAGLHAGLPVVVWCRETRSHDRLRADIMGLLDRGVLSLPAAVLRLRRDAVRLGKPADHLGLRLTLVWDDADRVPYTRTALRAPA
jgi:hypothetical protein